MKCKICNKESKYIFYDDGICHHWDRILNNDDIEEMKSIHNQTSNG